MTVDQELFTKFKEENKIDAALTLDQVLAPPSDAQIARDSWDDGISSGLLPGEKKKERSNPN